MVLSGYVSVRQGPVSEDPQENESATNEMSLRGDTGVPQKRVRLVGMQGRLLAGLDVLPRSGLMLRL